MYQKSRYKKSFCDPNKCIQNPDTAWLYQKIDLNKKNKITFNNPK